MIIYDPKITGSFQVNNTTVTSLAEIDTTSGSVASLNAATSSYALKTGISGSFTSLSSSLSTRLTNDESSITSLNTATSSYLQNTTDTLTGDLTVTGTLTAQDLHVQEITSSIVYSSGSNVFGALSSDTQKFTGSLQVSGSTNYLLGDVGIGQTSPNAKLEIYGTANSSPQTSNEGILKINSTATNAIVFGTLSGSPFGTYIQSGGSNTYPLLLNPNGGDVGIGTTSPSAKFHVDNSSADAIIRLTKGSSTIGNIDFVNEGNRFSIQDDGAKRLVIDTNGNVGIGTASPSQLLTVWGGNVYLRGGDSKVIINNIAGAANNEDVVFQRNDSTQFSLGLDSADSFTLFGSSTSTAHLTTNSSGSVGIGNTSPSAPLTVGNYISTHHQNHSSLPTVPGNHLVNLTPPSDTNYYGGGISWSEGTNTAASLGVYDAGGGGALGMYFATGDNTTLTERMRIDNSGLVKIGTSATVTPYSLSKFVVDTGTYAYMDLLSTSSAGINFGDAGGAQRGVIEYDHPSDYMRFITAGGERMRITSGGDIEIQGGDIFLNSGTNYNDKGVVYLSNERTAIISDIVNLTANGDTSLDFQTRSGGSRASAMFIDEFRNVGIGTTSPNYNLEINGSSAEIGLNGSAVYRLRSTNNDEFIITKNGVGDRLFISGAGNVGIGVTSPFGPFHVNGGTNGPSTVSNMSDAGIIVSNGTGGRAVQIATDNTDSFNYIQSAYVNNCNIANELRFYIGAVNTMTFSTSANVGIGSTSPSQKLDVSGNIYASGRTQSGNTVIGTKTISATNFATLGSNSSGVGIAIARDHAPSSYPDIVINSSGNVGIGTAAPLSKLDVNDTATVRGRLYMNTLVPLGIVYRFDQMNLSGGTSVTDAKATHGNAYRKLSTDSSGTMWFGPYTTFPAGNYIAHFRLKVASNSSTSTIIYMDVTNSVSSGINVSPSQFAASNQYKYFKIPFIIENSSASVELRGLSFASGITDLYFDHILILPGEV